MPKLVDSNILYSKLIEENIDRGYQVRLVVNEFREVIYIQLRKYFLSYDGDWLPSREGISMPASFENIQGMLDGLLDICASAEGEQIIQHYYDKLQQKNT